MPTLALEPDTAVGEMSNALAVAGMALADIVRRNAEYRFTPDIANTSAVPARKAIATEAVKQVVERASELVDGPGFMRGHTIERIVRDARAMHFHPLPVRRQQELSGPVALGLDPVK